MIAKKSTHNEYVILSKYIIGYSFLSFKVEKREPTDPVAPVQTIQLNSHKRINTKNKKIQVKKYCFYIHIYINFIYSVRAQDICYKQVDKKIPLSYIIVIKKNKLN